MPAHVSDARSNKSEQIAHAAEVLSNSKQRLMVFEAIYRGKKALKTRSELEAATGLDNKQVLKAGKALADNQLVVQEKKDGETAYRKDSFYAGQKNHILSLAKNPGKLAKQPRSAHSRDGSTSIKVIVKAEVSFKAPRLITIDEIDSFSEVRKLTGPNAKRVSLSEEAVKLGIQAVLGEAGQFKDWGGETNDVFTSRLVIGGKRRQTAMALKGPAQRGKLTPGKMGKNGDQIQRLFQADAEVFVLQYVGEIGEAVLTQMNALAIAKAVGTRKELMYCVVDGQDTDRLRKAYPEEFRNG